MRKANETNNEEQNVVKRGPGRPRKTEQAKVEKAPAKRGRPKKTAKVETEEVKTDVVETTEEKESVKIEKTKIKKQSTTISDITKEDFNTDDSKLVVYGLASLSKDVKKSVINVTDAEARFLVDTYYQVQAMRITSANQIRSIVQGADDNAENIPEAIQWTFENSLNQEAQIKNMLDYYSSSKPIGRWLKAITGIGPVLAAGLMSNFNLDKAPHYGNFVSFAGLNDYNNPWLGVEGAKKLVEEVYTELIEDDMRIADDYGCREKYLELMKEYSKKKNIPMDVTAILDGLNSPDIKAIYEDVEKSNPERAEDFIYRSFFDQNIVTDWVAMKVAEKANRTLKVVMNGLEKAKDKKKKVEYATKKELKAYLAKPPYSHAAKQLIFLIGESFVKVSNKPQSVYGRLYKERKAYEMQNNENGVYADQAAEILRTKNYGKDTESYKAYIQGKLPDAQIHRRSKRYACRILLSHFWTAMYIDRYGVMPEEKIYPIAHLEHVDFIDPEVPFSKLLDKTI